jgi:hypothetical protein
MAEKKFVSFLCVNAATNNVDNDPKVIAVVVGFRHWPRLA